MLATVEENPAEYEEDEEVLPLWRILSWFIMKKRKESRRRRRRRRNISPSQSSTSWRRVWIKRFGEQGETVVTKELDQFNKYIVFESKHANDLSEEEEKNAIIADFFFKRRRVEQ